MQQIIKACATSAAPVLAACGGGGDGGAGTNTGTVGTFATALPMAAPVRVAFAAIGPFSLGFVADVGAMGLYDIEAARVGVLQKQSINVSTVVPPLTFAIQ